MNELNKYRRDIDGLRGVAIILVIAFHFFPEVCPNGFIGVDIFFVISGFLIINIIINDVDRGKFSFLDFYTRRIKRIFPALIAVLFSSLIAGSYLLLPHQLKDLGLEVTAGAGFFANFLFWQTENYFNQNSIHKILLPLWSLSIEEQFYLLFPLIILICRGLNIRFIQIFLVIFLVSFFYNIYNVSRFPMESFYSPISRVWEFLIGGFLVSSIYPSLFKREWPNRIGIDGTGYSVNFLRLYDLAGIVGVATITYSLIYINKLNFPGWSALLPAIGCFLIIFGGEESFINKRVLNNSFLVSVGLISYPLYLWHWPILSFVNIYFDGHIPLIGKLSIVFLSGVLAYLTFYLIERPIRYGKFSRLGGKSCVAFLLIGVLLLIGIVGYVIFKANGLPKRFPLYVSQIENFQKINYDLAWGVGGCFLKLPEQNFENFSNFTSLMSV